MASRRRRAAGQHFLTDLRVVTRILEAARIGPSDRVLEVGPGHGALTGPLLETEAEVVAVEKDKVLASELSRRFAASPRLLLHRADAVKADLAAWGPYSRIVSNLPYSVSTPLTFRFLDLRFDSAVLMYQREFADRMLAAPGTSEYGRLTASLAYHVAVERVMDVGRGAFSPPPAVGSTVVRWTPHPKPPFPVASVPAYRELLRVAFTNRRKTLAATLRAHHSEVGAASPEAALARLEQLGWSKERPERLRPADFGRLSVELAETGVRR